MTPPSLPSPAPTFRSNAISLTSAHPNQSIPIPKAGSPILWLAKFQISRRTSSIYKKKSIPKVNLDIYKILVKKVNFQECKGGLKLKLRFRKMSSNP